MNLRSARKSASLLLLATASVGAFVITGCKTDHPKGAIIALYEKDGGPDFKRADGLYDNAAIIKFFNANPALTKDFVERPGGVCNLNTEPISDEMEQNKLICAAAIPAYHIKYDSFPVSK
jgi:hypothetical protein